MTDAERIYVAACKMKPGPMRELLLEMCTREYRLTEVLCLACGQFKATWDGADDLHHVCCPSLG